jgi:hypothetical protein
MKSLGLSPVSIILVIIAASSLISMIGLFQVDRMINYDLYDYGLKFSYGWAMPYWTLTKLMFAMGWFNIIVAITFHLYLLAYGTRPTKQFETEVEKDTSRAEIIEKTQPIKEEKIETQPEPETKSTESIEQQKEQELKPTEPVEEQQKETQIQETQEKKEESSTAVTDNSSQTQTEPKQPEQAPPEPVEQQKENTCPEETKTEQKETETKPAETQEKKEETPSTTELPREQELQPSATSVL